MLNLNILYRQRKYFFIWLASFLVLVSSHAYAEWNADWAARKKISINAQGLSEPVSNAQVVVRLHSGNFDFTSVNVDGSDIRFVAQDDKTELKFYIEKFDAVNELAIIWVQVPTINAVVKDAHFWLYYSNESATSNSSAKSISDASTVALFHFADKGLLQDSTSTNLQATGSVTAQKAGLVGESAIFNGSPINISESAAINPGAAYTWSAWVKPASLPQTSNLFSQKDGIVFGIDAQKLMLKIGDALMTGGELKPAVWQHVAFTIAGGKAKVYLDGTEVATGDVPTLNGSGGFAIGDAYYR
jgi:biopolymer transport protein ExbB